ncbi:MAG TPA: heparinase II/III family protein [Stellaceae bacterium]|nr:heparinase II/III family protein [Stellaceae bacterium]
MANLWEWLRRATPRGTLETSLLADGGHAGRSPAGLLEALEALIEKRDRLRAAGGEVPESLQQAIERGAAMLRFFRHGDGRLALFNGGIEDDVARIDLVLARSEAKGKAPARAPHSGFERIQAGRSLVIMDVGAAFPGHERHAHAGTLSFEMSHGRERLIVNCGAFKGEDPHWRRSFRASAAHSTLIVEETNSSELRADFRIGRRPRKIEVERVEEEGNHWLRAAHDGYEARFGLLHHREIFLAAEGEDLRGQDRLTGASGRGFAVRFHLHPEIQASLAQDGQSVLLRPPSGSGWRFRTQGALMSLAESLYLGTGSPRKTQQMVLTGVTGPAGAVIKWALRREKPENSGE